MSSRKQMGQMTEAVSSADLARRLTDDETTEWTDWRGGKPISQAQLAVIFPPTDVRGVPSTGGESFSRRIFSNEFWLLQSWALPEHSASSLGAT